MTHTRSRLLILVIGCATLLSAAAQETKTSDQGPATPVRAPVSAAGAASNPASAQDEAGDPRVNTSSAASNSTSTSPSTSSSTSTPSSTSSSSSASSPTPSRASTSGKPAKGSKNAADRVDLDTTTITGNRELPKVLYIVPWKRSDIGDLIGPPVNSLLDEVLAPVDRDVFRREVGYYQALKPDVGAKAGGPEGGGGPPPGP